MTPSRLSPAAERTPLASDVLAALVEFTVQALVADLRESVTGASARGLNRTGESDSETQGETACSSAPGCHADTASEGGVRG